MYDWAPGIPVKVPVTYTVALMVAPGVTEAETVPGVVQIGVVPLSWLQANTK
jgi:hypothetical protein